MGMATNRTEAFAAALNELENGGALEEFVSIFDDEAELRRPETHQRLDGEDGALAFWKDYLGNFDQIRSEFSRVVDGEVGVLEWTSSGRLKNGAPITYAGVSILDFDDSGKVARFSTYFDTQAFSRTDAR